jgi:molybdate/tungstate transport system ATP-binding protein
MMRVQSLCRRWGGFALRNIDLEVRTGDYLVILGPCGSGKTLLLETIAGLYSVDQGTVIINGRDVTRLTPEKRRIGLVYQQYALFPHLSVRQNIAYGLRYRNLSRRAIRDRVEEMIDLLGIHDLAERVSPNQLSGGEAQKVALARALAVRPDALLLDEPLSSLDPLARERIIDVLGAIGRRLEAPIIHVTHDYFEAAALANRVAVMRDGAIAQIGSTRDVFRRPASRFVAEFIGMENVLDCAIEEIGPDRCVVRFGDTILRVTTPPPDEDRLCLCIRPDDIRIRPVPGADAATGENHLAGTVEELRHEGFSVRMRVRVDSRRALIAVIPENRFGDLGVTAGTAVVLELPPDRLHLMRKDPIDHAA